MKRLAIAVLILLISPAASWASEVPSDRLYGKITTRRGEVLEGWIRWGGNEASWNDMINGSKQVPEEYRREANQLRGVEEPEEEPKRSIAFLGFRIGSDEHRTETRKSTGVRIGYLRTLQAVGLQKVLATLKDGRQIEISGSSGDYGHGLDRTEIDDQRKGTVRLQWRDIELVEFKAPPPDLKSRPDRRLFGTLTTEDGERFSGVIAWDLDEVLEQDVLDGRNDDGDQRIGFENIRSIARNDRRSVRVTLKSGEEMVLRGSNDVDDSNRGILIGDPALGQITVPWKLCTVLEFQDNPTPTAFNSFVAPSRLEGVVTTVAGESHQGRIRWDNDEEHVWEVLDGYKGDVKYEVEFLHVKAIERSSSGALITLRDGRRVEIGRNNDVSDGNAGIIVTSADGRKALVEWHNFARAEFP